MNFKLTPEITNQLSKMDFPRSVDIRKWKKYLNRKLTDDELEYINDLKVERHMNSCLNVLHDNVSKKNLCVTSLTLLSGNCLFESLRILGLYNDEKEFRLNISFVMRIFKDKKKFFSSREESLEEIFNETNDVDIVISEKTKLVYKYNYALMCDDLSESGQWCRLPTELILMTISKIYGVSFLIFTNLNDGNITINMSQLENPTVYNLGIINETHYVPLKQKENEDKKCPQHNDAKTNFIKFGIVSWMKMNKETNDL